MSIGLASVGLAALVALSPWDSRVVAPAAAAVDPVIVAAGDIACDPVDKDFFAGDGVGTAGLISDQCRQKSVAGTIIGINPTAVLDLGDNQYFCGSLNAFMLSYDKSWGQFKAKTHPVVGNHEYLTTQDPSGSPSTGCDVTNQGANGYYQYFGAAAGNPTQGYYSFDVGTWHLIALNSQCSTAGGCGATSPQGKWLKADLAAHAKSCTLAYWHVPLFSSGGRASPATKPFWDALYAAKADVVLTGHDHIYERFAPQTPAGAPDAVNGIREFVVGTGGANHTHLLAVLANNSVVQDTTTFGVLKMTLHAGSYNWQFVPSRGTFTDSGSASCHKGGTPPPPPPGGGTPPPPSGGTAPPLGLLAGGSSGLVHVTYPIRIDLRVKVLRSKKGVRRVTSRLIRPRLLHPYFVFRVDGTMTRVRVRIILVGQRGRIRGNIVRVVPTNRLVRLGGLPVPSAVPSMRVVILG